MGLKLEDIARIAGVSKATASLALNGSNMVKDQTREKIQKIARENNYIPHSLARGLARKKSGIIGVIVPDIESEYYGKLVHCLDEEIQRQGYSMVLAISNDKPETERKNVESFITQCVEGVIIAPINQQNHELQYLEELDENNISLVYVTAYYPKIERSCVMVDLEEGEYMLVQHLLSMGRKEILFLTGSHAILPSISRIKGYCRAFQERGMTVDQSNIVECEKIDYQYAYHYIEEYMIQGKKMPDAIIAVNDMMALGVVNALRAVGVNIPEQISVAGYDDITYSKVSPIPITTIYQDMGRMSLVAVNMLIEQINRGVRLTEKSWIDPEIIIRESTVASIKS